MRRATRLTHLGRPAYTEGRRPVNQPVVRASTVEYDCVDTMRRARARRDEGHRAFTYGLRGTPTTFALEDVITDLEGGFATKLFPSGLAAISSLLLTFLRPGEHVLVVDTVYEPTRRLLDQYLAERGIEHTFYSPRDNDLGRLVRDNTRLIYTETPGSVTMELQDLSRVVAVAREHGGIRVACDNTWSSGYCFRPLEHGADLSIIAGTKYLGGHSDLMLGSVTATEATYGAIHDATTTLGLSVSSDDCALALRGARTLHIRYPAHQKSAVRVARWLETRSEVQAVHYPALESSPDHALWQAQFEGAAGLFTVEFVTGSEDRVERFVDALRLFAIGSSWGGFESLVLPCDVRAARCVDDWSARGALVRFHIGLEDPEDLIEDLDAALSSVA